MDLKITGPDTGTQNSFIFKLFGICSQVVKSKVLKRLYPDFFESIEQNSPELLKVIESMNLVFMLDLMIDNSMITMLI